MDIIVYNEDKGVFEYSGNRPAFDFKEPDVVFQDGSVLNSEENKGKDICHSISFYTIATALTNALNFFIHFDEDNKALIFTMNYIAGTIVSVMTEKVTLSDEETCYTWIDNASTRKEQYVKYKKLMDDMIKATDYYDNDGDFLNCMIYHYFATKASEIARLLNSEPSNLRYGCGKWNRSIGRGYDPISCGSGDEGFLLTNTLDCIRITNLLSYTIGAYFGDSEEEIEEIPGNEDALIFYTCAVPNPKDPRNNIYLMCSSDLPPDLWHPADELISCKFPIYYRNYLQSEVGSDPDSWAIEQIPTYINGTP